MAENDIYNSKKKYEHFKERLEEFLLIPEKRTEKRGKCKYYCKNPDNLKYFKVLFDKLEARDISYIRRNRLIGDLRLITHTTTKDLKDLERDDIDEIMKFVNKAYPNSRAYFVACIKVIWKALFPEKDEKGRIEEGLVPYPVRHLTRKVDKSREKLREDRITFEEFDMVANYFNNDPKMQFYLFLSFESLGRPQEILYTKIKDLELFDNYAKIWISEHGKEGTKFLECIDSYPYLMKWYNLHPFKKNKEAYLFTKYNKDPKSQLTPKNMNKKLKVALNALGIEKPLTAYSLKRNGVTFRRLRGDSDVEIQHAAGWTSTKQLKNYDLSNQEDSLKNQLIKRGLLKGTEENKNVKTLIKTCFFCGVSNKFTDDFCANCKRLLNRTKIREQEEQNLQSLNKLKEAIVLLSHNIDNETRAQLMKLLV